MNQKNLIQIEGKYMSLISLVVTLIVGGVPPWLVKVANGAKSLRQSPVKNQRKIKS